MVEVYNTIALPLLVVPGKMEILSPQTSWD
jgi:hypothetical protein